MHGLVCLSVCLHACARVSLGVSASVLASVSASLSVFLYQHLHQGLAELNALRRALRKDNDETALSGASQATRGGDDAAGVSGNHSLSYHAHTSIVCCTTNATWHHTWRRECLSDAN